MVTRPVIFVDLDDTLFQTIGKAPPTELAHLIQVATARNGHHGMMTPRQKALTGWLLAKAETIPVTARSSAAFDRVSIPFCHGAILANGAVIRNPDGSCDQAWRAQIDRDIAPYAEGLSVRLATGREFSAAQGISVRSWIVTEDDRPVYIVFKENNGEGECLAGIAYALAGEGWYMQCNGNNLAVIPNPVSKFRAVEHVLRKIRTVSPDRPVLGFGDSLSDVPFLGLCDWWGVPRRSQIADFLGAKNK